MLHLNVDIAELKKVFTLIDKVAPLNKLEEDTIYLQVTNMGVIFSRPTANMVVQSLIQVEQMNFLDSTIPAVTEMNKQYLVKDYKTFVQSLTANRKDKEFMMHIDEAAKLVRLEFQAGVTNLKLVTVADDKSIEIADESKAIHFKSKNLCSYVQGLYDLVTSDTKYLKDIKIPVMSDKFVYFSGNGLYVMNNFSVGVLKAELQMNIPEEEAFGVAIEPLLKFLKNTQQNIVKLCVEDNYLYVKTICEMVRIPLAECKNFAEISKNTWNVDSGLLKSAPATEMFAEEKETSDEMEFDMSMIENLDEVSEEDAEQMEDVAEEVANDVKAVEKAPAEAVVKMFRQTGEIKIYMTTEQIKRRQEILDDMSVGASIIDTLSEYSCFECKSADVLAGINHLQVGVNSKLPWCIMLQGNRAYAVERTDNDYIVHEANMGTTLPEDKCISIGAKNLENVMTLMGDNVTVKWQNDKGQNLFTVERDNVQIQAFVMGCTYSEEIRSRISKYIEQSKREPVGV